MRARGTLKVGLRYSEVEQDATSNSTLPGDLADTCLKVGTLLLIVSLEALKLYEWEEKADMSSYPCLGEPVLK